MPAVGSGAPTAGASTLGRLRGAIGEVFRGRDEVLDLALATVLSGGHLLVQDVPGVGKTTLASALAAALGGRFARVQCTPDLLPSDLTGVNVLDRETGRFAFRPGPLFAHVVLADELNRTSARTQSALFEAMEEGQVTVDGTTHVLPRPFVVLATQNPFDHHGTYPIPESQFDRFAVQLALGYPGREDERSLLRRGSAKCAATRVLDPDGWAALVAEGDRVVVPRAVEDYLLDLVAATRRGGRIARGVSTRGAQALYRVVRGYAMVRGRAFAVPEDVREVAVAVLGHRIVARGAENGASAILSLLDEVAAPG
ncbi:MAG: MoxR family ATPase [Deltaproteobacteria bacterium]|nr:MoxR family ATPase [Deltaproteobacteria bacterium]